MSTKYCVNCDRVVGAKRIIGVGTFILALMTGGLWLLLILFYPKRCPICRGANFGKKPVDSNSFNEVKPLLTPTPAPTYGNHQTKDDPIEKIKKLQELKDSGAITEEEFNEKKKILLSSI